jgi:MFS family permease
LVALMAMELGSSATGAFLAAISYAFGTIALVYVRTFYAEPLLAFLTAGAMYLTLRDSTREICWAGVLAGLAVLAKPTGVVVGPVLAMFLLARRRSVLLSLAPATGTLIGLLLYMSYNEFRFEHALMFGQPWSFSLSSVPEGLAGLLVSPGRGLFWYSPVLVLAIAGFWAAKRTNVLASLMVVSLFAGFLAIYSLWSFWGGGWSWGPRFLLPGLPGLAALLGVLTAKWRRALIVLTFAGFFLSASTLFAFYERYYAEATEQGVSEQQLKWSVQYAAFLHAWPAAIRQVQDARKADVHELMAQRTESPAATIGSSRALRIVALWWWVLPLAHIPRAIGAAISFLMLAAGCWIMRRQFHAVCTILPD